LHYLLVASLLVNFGNHELNLSRMKRLVQELLLGFWNHALDCLGGRFFPIANLLVIFWVSGNDIPNDLLNMIRIT
jgi:hypothetical protein